MADKTNTRVTVDIPTTDHKKLKLLAVFHGKTMREIFIELIEHELEHYQECSENHAPNERTKKALKDLKSRKDLGEATTLEELFKKLDQ